MLQIFGFRKWKIYGQEMDDDNWLLVYFLFKLYVVYCQGDFACGDHPAESGPVYAVTDYLKRYIL